MSSYQVINQDVIKWAESYEGEPFHALCCDPPYHLTSITKRFGKPNSAPAKGDVYARASKGFMNTSWDGLGEDGKGIAFKPETWAALGQHLYPGAFGLAFASSRGWHRMAVAIEDAGFIIHPSIFMLGYSYGCLSEDTEILTKDGWQLFRPNLLGSTVLGYNVDSNSLDWMEVQEVYEYDYNDTAYRIQSDQTDQIVSKNHRCLVERDGNFVFRQAETLQPKEGVPILEGLPELRRAVPGKECGRVVQKESLLQSVYHRGVAAKAAWSAWEAEAPKQQSDSQPQRAMAYLRNMPGEVLPSDVEDKEYKIRKSLLQQMSVHLEITASKNIRTSQEYLSLRSRGEQYTRDKKQKRAAGREKSSLEGRSNLLQNSRQLYRRQVCEMPARVQGNGPQRWIHNGASLDSSSTSGATTETVRSSSPYQSRPVRQQNRESNAVCQQYSTQEIRGNRKPSTTLATVTPIHYTGKVWCVRVPTGAFVARRNGRIFITGNSGFPKATRIDTQVDRAAGAKGRASGVYQRPDGKPRRYEDWEGDSGYEGGWSVNNRTVIEPATDLAKTWAGHRYGLQALKPALEPIIVFQRPYEGRPVDNITQTGAGALNIDAGRIGTDITGWGGHPSRGYSGGLDSFEENGRPVNGRWPSNLLLHHNYDCQPGQCSEGCPVERLGEQSGWLKSGEHKGELDSPKQNGACYGKFNKANINPFEANEGTAARFFFQADWHHEILEQLMSADPVYYTAKASRTERQAGLDGPNNHPTVKSISLTKYLASLLLPPNAYAPRRILIPFSGVGSEMAGAVLAGWDEVTGIEQGAPYCKLAESRLSWWSQWPGWGQTDVDKILQAANDKETEAGQISLFDLMEVA